MRSRARVRRRSILLGLAALSVLAALLVLESGCSRAPSPPEAALQSFSAEALMRHIRALSSDEFEGRGPGSKGEQLTIRYLEQQFRGLGLEPGNPDGSYLQSVPLVGITPDPKMKLTFSGRGRTLQPQFRKDFVAWTKRVQDSAAIDAEMVFVGYGVQAPEFHWDDFKGTDVKGKVIVVLINDPPVEDERIFGGKAMTYYGRWTYKFEKAAELGAAGCLIIHNTERAGYPWKWCGTVGAASSSTWPLRIRTWAAWPSKAGSLASRPRRCFGLPAKTWTRSRRPRWAAISDRCRWACAPVLPSGTRCGGWTRTTSWPACRAAIRSSRRSTPSTWRTGTTSASGPR